LRSNLISEANPKAKRPFVSWRLIQIESCESLWSFVPSFVFFAVKPNERSESLAILSVPCG